MPIAPISGSPAPISFDLLKQAGDGAATSGSRGDFGKAVTGALNHLNTLQHRTDALAEQAATGELNSVTDYMVAATETQLTTQLTVAVRNKALDAYNEILRMQV